MFSFGWSAFLAWRFDRFFFLCRLLPPCNRCRIPAHMAYQFCTKILFYQGIMYNSAQISSDKFSKGAGECRFRGDILLPCKPADEAEIRSCLQPMDQRTSMLVPKNRLYYITTAYHLGTFWDVVYLSINVYNPLSLLTIASPLLSKRGGKPALGL